MKLEVYIFLYSNEANISFVDPSCSDTLFSRTYTRKSLINALKRANTSAKIAKVINEHIDYDFIIATAFNDEYPSAKPPVYVIDKTKCKRVLL